MIQNLEIQNFKSIKELRLSCKKVNVFIGEPNAGKTNVIEALSIFSNHRGTRVNENLRYRSFAEIFPGKDVKKTVSIQAGNFSARIELVDSEYVCSLDMNGSAGQIRISAYDQREISSGIYQSPFKFYQYKSLPKFGDKTPGALLPPFGDNLITSLSTNPETADLIGEIYGARGFRLVLDEEKSEVSLIKDIKNISSLFSFEATSDTLRRITFLMLALETNKDSILLFDEPEASLFPFYIKYFTEQLAYDETNQFFFTTHNPYLMEALVAKTKPEDLNIVVTYMEDYETKIRVLADEEILEHISSDIFFNIKRLVQPA